MEFFLFILINLFFCKVARAVTTVFSMGRWDGEIIIYLIFEESSQAQLEATYQNRVVKLVKLCKKLMCAHRALYRRDVLTLKTDTGYLWLQMWTIKIDRCERCKKKKKKLELGNGPCKVNVALTI